MTPEDLAAFARRHGLDALATTELRALMERSEPSLPDAFLTEETDSIVMSAATLTGVLPDRFIERIDTELAPRDEPKPTDMSRYEDRGLIARGGVGEVRRAYDRVLQRTVAMKTLHVHKVDGLTAHRFHREAVVTAQLQHPVIVPIYDLGQRPDGTRFYTMREVSGSTLHTLIERVHATHATAWRPTSDGWSLHRLVRSLARVSEAVAFAHAHGAVHRDLKPANVMVGDYGDVQLLDWGLVKVVGDGVDEPAAGDNDHTRYGSISGTPAFMAPEQARGELDRIGPATDVYALGALLYCILTGGPPYQGDIGTILLALIDGDLTRPVARTSKPLPPELEMLCMHAMSSEIPDRPSATSFTAALDTWLDGSVKQQQAAALVDEAQPLLRRAHALGQRAIALERKALSRLEAIPDWASESTKAPAWKLEEEAQAQARESREVELQARRCLHQAIVHDAACIDAHDHLAERFRADHVLAEAAHDEAAAQRAADQLSYHAAALPEAMAVDHRRYLKGDGSLIVRSSPPGATATLYRYERKHRRYGVVKERVLGTTPLETRLPMGRYQVVLRLSGHHTLNFPVHVRRGERVDRVPPNQHDPEAVKLLERGSLGANDVYVPAGWCMTGDSRCDTASPPRNVWVDGFVISRFPITVAEYIAFLDDLVAQGRTEDALQHQPRRGIGGRPWVLQNPSGGFEADPDGILGGLDWPVIGIDHLSACAYLDWLSAKTGVRWRLPAELEWEKAARGVDGRLYPWGDAIDPTWARIRASSRTRPLPDSVDSYPVDTSPFGVRGMGGNVADWCADSWRAGGPDCMGDRAVLPSNRADDPSPRVVRGGHWLSAPSGAQVPGRRRAERTQVSRIVGFRKARSV